MKKIFLLVFASLFSIALFANRDTTNKVDDKGLRQGYWIVFNTIKKLPNYSEDAKVEEGSYSDSRKNGIWKTYHPNGILKNEITYSNNRPSGNAKIYDDKGTLIEEGVWQNNRWTGHWKSYHENGQTFMDFNYNAGGKRQGEQQYYYENGQPMMKGNMNDGKEAGTWVGYYENGDKREEKVFTEGTLDAGKTKVYPPATTLPETKTATAEKTDAKQVDVKAEKTNEAQKPFDGNGYAKLFFPGARISKDGEFKNFRLVNGKDYIYNSVGILERIAVYKEGKYIGDAPIEQKDKENNVLVPVLDEK